MGGDLSGTRVCWWHDSGAMARPASDLWSPRDLLQSLRSVAAGWRLDQIMDALLPVMTRRYR